MKRIGTMKRMVRLAVGSLCLLALMVHTAPAADPPPQIFCLGNYDAATRGISAEVSVANIASVPQQFAISVFNEQNPQGAGKIVTLAPFQTIVLTSQDLNAVG